MAHHSAVVKLDPYLCIPKRNQKYASECTEVYLSNSDGTTLSEGFKQFPNIEVLWINGNRLPRIDNLESNFRIKEVYAQDNILVSLSGIRTFKFLRVLLASNNQIQNLDKQIGVLSRFAFLNKLDLFGNPCAEEPDYRLRLIYNIPQVELLDRSAVKVHERLQANEVVPMLDKVSEPRPERRKKKRMEISILERECFQGARSIRKKRAAEEEEMLLSTGHDPQGLTKSVSMPTLRDLRGADYEHEDGEPSGNRGDECFRATRVEIYGKDPLGASVITREGPLRMANFLCGLRHTFGDSKARAVKELHTLTPWEKNGIHSETPTDAGLDAGLKEYIEKVAGKEELGSVECVNLIRALEKNAGPSGRILTDPILQKVLRADSKHRGSSRFSRTVRTSVLSNRSSFGNLAGVAKSASQLASFVSELPETGPLAKLRDQPEANVDTAELAAWLVGLQWSFKGVDELNSHIALLYEQAKRAESHGNMEKAKELSIQALRFEGVKSRRQSGEASLPPPPRPPQNRRVDLFQQSFLKPCWVIDEKTGRDKLSINKTSTISAMGG